MTTRSYYNYATTMLRQKEFGTTKEATMFLTNPANPNNYQGPHGGFPNTLSISIRCCDSIFLVI